MVLRVALPCAPGIEVEERVDIGDIFMNMAFALKLYGRGQGYE